MKLTQYTDYSLRVLLFLGALDKGELVQIQDVASIYHLSKNHLTKVVHHLGKLDLIETIRGRGGGIRLKQDPEQINIGWVVRQTEEDFHIVECFAHKDNACRISSICLLKGILHEALDAYLNVLDRYTLKDILANKQALQPLLFQG
ncbi:Rrf2 family transcriptional regulator [Pullulanibacillus sp. KACC 23026]|uniref:RrF2 family transcriptional regulator n=1 Tax=Pullulanibacillus sp. KACC 23026 TaxID=3028315 RepID=UPI0023AE800A|nr:Rrf2 family transcriptional regulator [Pullulanibacillus sp. KACC 23026]WEG13930.1 Rrf2 family transcriptional regulator [Pullulanibacillus sp. KACC 23026]